LWDDLLWNNSLAYKQLMKVLNTGCYSIPRSSYLLKYVILVQVFWSTFSTWEFSKLTSCEIFLIKILHDNKKHLLGLVHISAQTHSKPSIVSVLWMGKLIHQETEEISYRITASKRQNKDFNLASLEISLINI
jgi:hypothetical protein